MNKILIIDDEINIQKSISDILFSNKFIPIECSNPTKAIDIITNDKIDLVLLDIWMPEMDGHVLLKAIKKLFSDLPVIIMSGHANINTTLEVTKSGAEDFIEKPFTSTQLILKIKKYLSVDQFNKEDSGNSIAYSSLLTKIAQPQKTISKNGVLTGKGLHSGTSTGIILSALPENRGIIFEDITSGTQIKATALNVDSTSFSTNLQNLDKGISCVEHLMASFLIFGIDNILVKVNTEIPIFDGSANSFCKLISDCGITEQSENKRIIKINKEFAIQDNESEDVFIKIEPSEIFKITYTFELPGKGKQTVNYTFDDKNAVTTFIKEIAPARTFGFLNELKALQANGLGQGGDMENFLLMDEQKVINTELRFPDEPARHKVLDIIGDIYLLGAPVIGHITASKTGHRHNISLVRQILDL